MLRNPMGVLLAALVVVNLPSANSALCMGPPTPRRSRSGIPRRGKSAVPKPSGPRFRLPKVTLPQPEELLESVKDAAATFRPLQVLTGFVLALMLVGGSIVATGRIVGDFLAEDGRGEVIERAILFGAILGDVQSAYVEKGVDVDRLFQTGVNAMLNSLDPYSTYENARQAEDLNVRTTGRYGGVGLTIARSGDEVVVLGALEGYAFDAGVRPGDRINEIDGVLIKSSTPLDEVKEMLRGEPGTGVELVLSRGGSPKPVFSLLVPRKLVRLPDVSLCTVMRPGVGYIKLDGFSEGTAEELAQGIESLQSSAELSSLVIDLRDNPGGLLDAAVSVAQQFVPQGTEIVSTSGRLYGEDATLTYRSSRPPLVSPSTKLVLLVNGNTASAAEIVSGAVQDTDRGVVVGQRTFGKGLVQVVEPLPGGGSLKLTVAKYFTPSGRCIQALSYSSNVRPAPAESETDEDTEDGFESSGRTLSSGSIAKPVAKDTKVYSTIHGRPVQGGGGIAPDVVSVPMPIGALERSLLQRGAFFKYADEWLQRHKGVPTAQERALAQEDTYRDFVQFARSQFLNKKGEDQLTLQDPTLNRQLKLLEKALNSKEEKTRSSKQLQVLRKLLVDEELAQFQTQKEAILLDVREAVLGRLTSPSIRLRSTLSTDPQVIAALNLVADDSRYYQILQSPARPS